MRQTAPTLTRRLAVIDPTTDARWDAFVRAHPASTVFHTAAWARVLMATYGYEPRYHVLEGRDGTIAAAWPLMLVSSRLTGRRLVSLPFSDHCEPLVHTAADAATLLDAIMAEREQCAARRIEVRGWPPTVSAPARLTPLHYFGLYTVEIAPDPAESFQRLPRATRKRIHQAQERGVSVRLAEGRADLQHFYRLNVVTRRRHGVLPQPFALFEAIDRYVLQPGLGRLALAEVSSRPVAAALTLTHGDTIVAKSAPSDAAYWPHRPNDLLEWTVLEWACERGFRRYDLGRCSLQDSGLAFHKEQWGAVRGALPYLYYPAPGGLSTTDPTGLKKRMLSGFAKVAPDPLFVTAGRYLYRHLG